MLPFDGERLARAMRDAGADVVLASSRHNVRYLTGGYYLPFYARMPRFGRGQYLSFVGVPRANLASSFYVGRRDATLNEEDYIAAFGPFWIAERCGIARGANMSAAAAEAAAGALRERGLAGATVAVELPFLPADAFDAFRRALPEAAFTDATPILGDVRAVKRPEELARLAQVHRLTAEAVRAVLGEGRPEQTTREVAAAAERRIVERGARFLYALTNVGPGLLRAPSDARWGTRRPLHLDAGAELDEYVADIARMGSVGAPPPAAMELFQACLDAQARVRAALGPGMPAWDLWRLGRDAVGRGPGAPYGRFLAHGIGMVSHEPPEIDAESDRPLEASMVLSLEAEYRHPEVGHIKIEDTVVLTPTGCAGLGDVARDWCVAPRQ